LIFSHPLSASTAQQKKESENCADRPGGDRRGKERMS